MFKKRTILIGLILLLAIGVLASLGWAGVKRAEKTKREPQQIETQKGPQKVPETTTTTEATTTPESTTTTEKEQTKEKRRVLVLQIIEENWDNLELRLPMYKIAAGRSPKPITKKKALQEFERYGPRVTDIPKKGQKMAVGVKKGGTRIEELKEIVKNRIKFSLSKRKDISKSVTLCVDHEIKYYGKTYFLNDEDTFMKDAFRIDQRNFNYCFTSIPEKISLLVQPESYVVNYKKYIPADWDYFQEIRLVKDIYIQSTNEKGELIIKYGDNTYKVKEKDILELPVEEKDLTREEMMRFRERYYEHYKERCTEPWMGTAEGKFRSQLFQISIPNKTFHFGTKVTLINYGYMEVE